MASILDIWLSFPIIFTEYLNNFREKAGDEIVIDYNYLGEPEELKDDFYKNS